MARRKNPKSAEQQRESLIQKAVSGVQTGKYANCAAAARAIGNEGLRWTINRRLNGTKPRTEAHTRQQLLNTTKEKVLTQYIKFLSLSGFPLSKRTIAPKVQALCGRKPGRDWVYRFLRRHPECKLGRPSGLDPLRAQCFNFSNVDAYFKKVQAIIDEHQIPWENIYNFDEIGIQVSGGRKGTGEVYFFHSADKAKSMIKSDDLEMCTLIECVCADGTATVKPCFIGAGTKMCKEWFDDSAILLATSDNGWTSNRICQDWFRKSFLPLAREHSDPSKPILLLFDGHVSHATLKMIDMAIAQDVILYELPAHTTHRLQPCDVGAFGPLKREWIKRCEEFLEETGQPMQIQDVPREYLKARRIALKEETIRQAFYKSGIQQDAEGKPFCNIARFTEDDFAPSIATSTQLHLPEGYPKDHGDIIPQDEEIGEPYASSSEDGEDDESTASEPEDGCDSDHAMDQDPPDFSGMFSGPLRARESSVDDDDMLDDTSTALYPRSPLPIDPALEQASGPSSQGLSGPSGSSSHMVSASQAPSVAAGSSVSFLHHSEHPLIDHYADSASESSESEPEDLEDRATYWKAKASKYYEQRNKARGERDEVTAHAILTGRTIGDLQRKLNTKPGRKKSGRTVDLGGRCVTTEEGREAARAQELAQEEKLKKTQKAAQRKEEAALNVAARRVQLGRDGMSFSGALDRQKLEPLADIAWSLGLSDKGKREDLIARIRDHFDSHPELRSNSRFCKLFTSKRAAKAGAGSSTAEAAS